ncbi:branched chain amino acid ABC transporter substrate-binding protein [Ktedonobacteria bacterium brp13]|nr:branched chain amino acid ABC transporter substrate-binding protein [Ktedonobacteria bacterium brp13]
MQKRTRTSRIFASLSGLFLSMVLLAACGAGTGGGGGTGGGTSTGPVTIEIGSELPTTGGDTSTGKPAQNGVALAIQQANASNFLPGYKFVLVPKDDVGVNGTHDPTVGQKNINDLVGDAQVAGIVGPINSSVALAEMPTANRAPITLLSPANTNDCLTNNVPAAECGGSNNQIPVLRPTGNVTYFRTATLDQYQGKALADFAYQTKHYHSVYVIDDTETYGVGLAGNFINTWKSLGGTVIDHASIKSTGSYENILTTIAAKHPDAIFFGGNDSTGGITIRQQMAHVPGLENTPFIVGDGAKTVQLAKDIKPLNGGPVFGSIPGSDPEQSASYSKFFSDYAAAFGSGQYGAYSAGGYDDASILLQAIKAAVNNKAVAPKNSNDAATAKTFRQAVIDAMKTISYTGVTGHQAFDQNGDTTDQIVSIYTLGDLTKADGWSFITQINATK